MIASNSSRVYASITLLTALGKLDCLTITTFSFELM